MCWRRKNGRTRNQHIGRNTRVIGWIERQFSNCLIARFLDKSSELRIGYLRSVHIERRNRNLMNRSRIGEFIIPHQEGSTGNQDHAGSVICWGSLPQLFGVSTTIRTLLSTAIRKNSCRQQAPYYRNRAFAHCLCMIGLKRYWTNPTSANPIIE